MVGPVGSEAPDAAAAAPATAEEPVVSAKSSAEGRRFTRTAQQARPEVLLDDSDAESSDEERQEKDDEKDEAEPDGGEEDRAQALNQYNRRQRLAKKKPEMASWQKAGLSGGLVRPAAQVELQEKRGWAEKASSSWFAGWQRRWVVLKDRTLKWYKSDSEDVAQGTVDFDLVQCEVEQLWSLGENGALRRQGGGSCFSGRSGKCSFTEAILGSGELVNFRLCAVGSNRAIEMRVQGPKEGEAWVDAISRHLRRADPKTQRCCSELHHFGQKHGAWWKVHRISPETFVDLAQTGDVLLFRSKGTFPRLIRAASGNGRFDHVGLVLRLVDGGVGLLESTGNEGVGVCSWKEFVANNWQELYPELALRRAFFNRSEEVLTKLQEWCAEVIGKPYGLTLSKLSQRRSVSTGGSDTNSDFFCSQLVAEALKVLGVVPRGVSSTQFWPSSFSAKQQPPITCCAGCSLSDTDLTIDFSLGEAAGRQDAKADGGGKSRDATTNWG